MSDQFSRTRLVIGKDGQDKLLASRVAVFGLGGVGAAAVEALARAGLGSLDLIDNDQVSLTNINRQFIALHSSVGRNKTEVEKERVLDINPSCRVRVYSTFFLEDTAEQFDFKEYDYVADCVDTISAKTSLILKCKEAQTPIICSMGTGNKVHPEMLKIADIYDTKICPMARVMRHEMRKRGVESLKVVYSEEEPLKLSSDEEVEKKVVSNRPVPGSTSFVPPAAGLIMAGAIVRDILGLK